MSGESSKNNNNNNSNGDKLVIGEFKAIGFDVDHTLVEYKYEMELMLYECVARYLVQYFGYSPILLIENTPLQTEFLSRGLLLDKARGNVIKLDCFRNLAMGYHGKRPLTDAEIARYYGKGTDFDIDFQRVADNFLPIHTFFDRVLGPLWINIVELLGYESSELGDRVDGALPSINGGIRPNPTQPTKTVSYLEAFDHLLKSIKYNQSRHAGPEWFNSRLISQRSLIVSKNAHVREWLRQLKIAAGAKLFLITNADYNHCDLMLGYMIGEDWDTLFDFAVVEAKKPTFFTSDHPFEPVTNMREYNTHGLHRCKFYRRGNGAMLERIMGIGSIGSRSSSTPDLQPRKHHRGRSSAFLGVIDMITLLSYKFYSTENGAGPPALSGSDDNSSSSPSPDNSEGHFVNNNNSSNNNSNNSNNSGINRPSNSNSRVSVLSSSEKTVLFFGDHILQDLASTATRSWTTIAVVPELLESISGCRFAPFLLSSPTNSMPSFWGGVLSVQATFIAASVSTIAKFNVFTPFPVVDPVNFNTEDAHDIPKLDDSAIVLKKTPNMNNKVFQYPVIINTHSSTISTHLTVPPKSFIPAGQCVVS